MEQKTESKKVIVFKAEPKEQAAYDEIARRFNVTSAKFAQLLATRVRKGIPVLFAGGVIFDRGLLIERATKYEIEGGIVLGVHIDGVYAYAALEPGKAPEKHAAFPEWAMKYLGEIEARND